jgi:hypothetical protein
MRTCVRVSKQNVKLEQIMKTVKRLNYLRGICCVLTVGLMLSGIRSALAFSQSTQALAYACWINNFYFQESDGEWVFRNQEGANGNTSFWQGAEMIEVVEDAIEAGVDTTARLNALCTSFIDDNSSSWTWNTYNDDIMWASRAFVRAYYLTGNSAYLTDAENNWTAAFNRGWCYSCGGGLYQDTGAGSSFCTCANAPAADCAYMIYAQTGITSYLTNAQLIYNWMVANDYNIQGNGGVEEGPGNPGVYFSYDQGTFSMIAYWLGDTARVNAVAGFVQNEWGTAMQSFGTGSDAGGFNGICLRGLMIGGANIPFLQACCDQAWTCRNNQGLTSVNFGSVTPSGTDLYCWDCTDMVAGMCCVPPAPASLNNGTVYTLAPQNATGQRLDVKGAGGSGTDCDSWQSNGGSNQKWQLSAVSGMEGVYNLIPQNSTGSTLDVYGSETTPGTIVDIYSNHDSINQQWRIIPVNEANLIYSLQPLNALPLRLDVEGDSGANGAAIDVWTSDSFPWISGSGLNQQWHFSTGN